MVPARAGGAYLLTDPCRDHLICPQLQAEMSVTQTYQKHSLVLKLAMLLRVERLVDEHGRELYKTFTKTIQLKGDKREG